MIISNAKLISNNKGTIINFIFFLALRTKMYFKDELNYISISFANLANQSITV